MSLEDERRRNREKQRRFRLRHPDYVKAQYERRKQGLVPRSTGRYRTFELVDPRDPEQLPRLIGCGLAKSPWSNLWAVRHYSHATWAIWFQELEIAGLKPEEYASPWRVGVPDPVRLDVAIRAMKYRISRISLCTTGGCPPAWLLRHSFGPVAYEQDGHIQRYRSMRQALYEVGKDQLYNTILLARTDRQGRTWFDD
jgi:hypothetical protein